MSIWWTEEREGEGHLGSRLCTFISSRQPGPAPRCCDFQDTHTAGLMRPLLVYAFPFFPLFSLLHCQQELSPALFKSHLETQRSEEQSLIFVNKFHGQKQHHTVSSFFFLASQDSGMKHDHFFPRNPSLPLSSCSTSAPCG